MVNVKKRNILISLICVLCAALAALAIGFLPKTTVKADESPDFTGYTVEDLTVGTQLAGKYIYVSYHNSGVRTSQSDTFVLEFDFERDRFNIYDGGTRIYLGNSVSLDASEWNTLTELGLSESNGKVYYCPAHIENYSAWDTYELQSIFVPAVGSGNIVQKVLVPPVGIPVIEQTSEDLPAITAYGMYGEFGNYNDTTKVPYFAGCYIICTSAGYNFNFESNSGYDYNFCNDVINVHGGVEDFSICKLMDPSIYEAIREKTGLRIVALFYCPNYINFDVWQFSERLSSRAGNIEGATGVYVYIPLEEPVVDTTEYSTEYNFTYVGFPTNEQSSGTSTYHSSGGSIGTSSTNKMLSVVGLISLVVVAVVIGTVMNKRSKRSYKRRK